MTYLKDTSSPRSLSAQTMDFDLDLAMHVILLLLADTSGDAN